MTTSSTTTLRHRAHRAAASPVRFTSRLGISSLGLLALLSPAAAQTNLWTGSDSSWLTPGNWSLASAPVAGQEARILNGGTARVGSSVVAGALYLGVNPGTSGSLVIGAGGTLNAATLNLGYNGGDGSVALEDGGVLRVGNGGGMVCAVPSWFRSGQHAQDRHWRHAGEDPRG